MGAKVWVLLPMRFLGEWKGRMKVKSISMLQFFFAAFFLFVCCQNGAPKSAENQADLDEKEIPIDFMRGFDASTVDFLEECGAVYRDENGIERDVFFILKSHGVNWIRLRIWHTPSKNAAPGDNDLMRTIRMAKRIKSYGLQFLLDFHYSDTWADPGSQRRPAQWDGCATINELADAIHSYTEETLLSLKENDCLPDMVQLGNEINSGLCTLMSDGTASRIPISSGEQNDEGNKNLVILLKAASEAVNAVDPAIKRMIHLASDGSCVDSSWWFERINGFDFECIGLSYYVFENHGTILQLRENISNLMHRYNKDIVVCETSWAWTFDKYGNDSQSNYVWYDKGVEAAMRVSDVENSALKELQFIKYTDKKCLEASVKNQEVVFRAIIEATVRAGGCGVFYWGGDWICDPNGSVDNNWENQALFDLTGNCLSSMNAFNQGFSMN